MSGITDIGILLKAMTPLLNEGEYVFCAVADLGIVDMSYVLSVFKEKEAITIILKKSDADKLGLTYNYVAAWITLNVHSSLQAVGLTAAFSGALAASGISCNVVAGFYHDHIFVAKQDALHAMECLKALSAT